MLWDRLRKWLRDVYNINIIVDDEMCIFGVRDEKQTALNVILLLCRFHIYKMKMSEKRPNFMLLSQDIKRYQNLEKYIYSKNLELYKFNKKWDSL